MIADGLVTIDGAPALKASTQVAAHQQLNVQRAPSRFVSRGGEKLAHALERFHLDVANVVALDAGISTGGFTDCLLQHGAARIVGYDVGYGQVHERLRSDPRVTVFERTNVRDLTVEDLPSPKPHVLVADLSFISLRLVLPVLLSLLDPVAQRFAVVLVKPQFEAARHEIAEGGVVDDPKVWRRCLRTVSATVTQLGWRTCGLVASPLLGPAGNVEFLAYLRPIDANDATGSSAAAGRPNQDQSDDQPDEVRVAALIEAAVTEGEQLAAGAG